MGGQLDELLASLAGTWGYRGGSPTAVQA